MFLISSALKNEDFIFKKQKEEPVNEKKISTKELLCGNIDHSTCESIIRDLVLKKNKEENEIIDNNVYDDLEIFKGLDNPNNSIFNTINKTKTIFGRNLLKISLNNPTTNIDLLKKKQQIIKKLLKDEDKFKQIQERIESIAKLQDTLLWTLKPKSIEEEKIFEAVYFNHEYLKAFNSSEEVLTVYSLFKIVFAPVYGLLSPILFFIIPYLYLYFFTKIKFDFKVYFKILKMSFFGGFDMTGAGGGGISRYFSMMLSFVIYVQNLVNSVEVSRGTNNIINILHEKINDTNKISKELCSLKELTKDIFDFSDIKHHFPIIDNELFNTQPTLFSNKGKILVCYNKIQNSESYIDLINEIALIDYYNSLCLLIKDNNNICYPTYVENEHPIINAKDIYHPYLTNAISNDLLIGKKNPNNILITGPNAGGKSTFIKSLSLSVIASQTLGIAFCKSLEITPFSLINTYLNIPDCKGKESLFEAEMHRARDHIRKLNELSKHKFSFIVMDEIFNSTNPQEGISGAYAIAEKLANFKNSISIITTHFTYLTNLETNKSFKNYKIPIKRDNDDNIVYPYKLKSGVSNQYIALELLRNKGFDNDLVDNAEDICKNLNLNSSSVNLNVSEKSTNTSINIENESNSDSKTSESKSENKNDLRTELLSEPENEESDLEFIEESDNETENESDNESE
jgi:DNA mismatch repair protein MutS